MPLLNHGVRKSERGQLDAVSGPTWGLGNRGTCSRRLMMRLKPFLVVNGSHIATLRRACADDAAPAL